MCTNTQSRQKLHVEMTYLIVQKSSSFFRESYRPIAILCTTIYLSNIPKVIEQSGKI